jgi:uncharacterized membrane protein (UPF0127 family)
VRVLKVENVTRGATLGTAVGVADGWWARFRGLRGRRSLEVGAGLLLTPCRSIHMMGMSFPIDVVFVDSRGIVVGLYRHLAPGAVTRWLRNAQHALELPPGTLEATDTRLGDLVAWQMTVQGLPARSPSTAESAR